MKDVPEIDKSKQFIISYGTMTYICYASQLDILNACLKALDKRYEGCEVKEVWEIVSLLTGVAEQIKAKLEEEKDTDEDDN